MGLCRACKQNHPATQRCEVAARMAGVTRNTVEAGLPVTRNKISARAVTRNKTDELADRDAEIARLRARIVELEKLAPTLKPNSRAEYMRAYRAKRG